MAITPNGKPPASLLDRIKADIARAAQARSGVFYVKAGQKQRVRFLTEFTSAMEVEWHMKWVNNKAEVDTPCLKTFGKDCAFCGQADVKTRTHYIWQVYNYERSERQLFCFAANRATPVIGLAEIFENEEYGTLLKCDLIIAKHGEGPQTFYTVTANPPKTFREDVKRMGPEKLLKTVWEAYGTGDLDKYPDLDEDGEAADYDDEAEEAPAPVKKRKVAR